MCEKDYGLSDSKNLDRVVVAYSKVMHKSSAGKTDESNETPDSDIETGNCFHMK
jgi:hypothetical protein